VPTAPTIESARLTLRGWRDDDVEPWTAMGADERVMEFFPGTYDRPKALSIAALIRAALDANGHGWWVLEPKEGPAFGGVIALQAVPFEAPFTPAIEVGWRLPYDLWGKGYATEGARAALNFAFDKLHVDEVVAMTSALNLRSQRVMERLGMTRDPGDDFDHPKVPAGNRLQRHVLYRIRK
jgi:RimJ/RimL family protein N-acetyltransferase